MITNLLSNVRIRNTIILALVGLIVYVFINVYGAGYLNFLGTLNAFITVVIAGCATGFCWYYWSILNKADPIEKVWRILGIGLGLWTVAETIWSFQILRGGEISYPSLADGLWVAGYVFYFLPFILLYRLLQINPSARTIAGVFGFAILYIIVVTVYVITPIIQDPGSSWLEKTLGAIYPIGDLVVAVGASLVALALMGGAFSWVWTFIAVGFLSQSFSDTLFTYADWNGLYMPDGSLNFLSIMVDMTYILGYALVAIGIYIQIEFTVNEIEEPLVDRYRSLLDEQNNSLKSVKITLFTDSEDNIISASPAVAYLRSSEKGSLDLYGMPFYQAVGLDADYARQLLQDMKENGTMSSRSFNVLAADNQPAKAKISGTPNFNVADRYIGLDIIITLRINADLIVNGIEAGLEEELAATTDGESAEERLNKKLVPAFFVEKVHVLYVITSRFGGANAAKSLERIFNANAGRLHLTVQMDGPNVVFDSKTHNLPLYRELLKSIINYTIAISSLEVVRREIDKVERQLDREMIQAGKDTGLYGLSMEMQQADMSK